MIPEWFTILVFLQILPFVGISIWEGIRLIITKTIFSHAFKRMRIDCNISKSYNLSNEDAKELERIAKDYANHALSQLEITIGTFSVFLALVGLIFYALIDPRDSIFIHHFPQQSILVIVALVFLVGLLFTLPIITWGVYWKTFPGKVNWFLRPWIVLALNITIVGLILLLEFLGWQAST